MTENISQICCFTGHREQRLQEKYEIIQKRLSYEIDSAVNDGKKIFISGMASGFDLWAAEEVLRQKNRDILLYCALPYENFVQNRSDADRAKTVLKNADFIYIINKTYYRGIYFIRNKWMVDNSSLVIAAYDGGTGGTRQTVDYAQKKGIEVRNILHPDTLSLF